MFLEQIRSRFPKTGVTIQPPWVLNYTPIKTYKIYHLKIAYTAKADSKLMLLKSRKRFSSKPSSKDGDPCEYYG
jgi:hypothetical protein